MSKTKEYSEVLEMLVKMRVKHTVRQCVSSTTIKLENGKSYFYPNSGEYIDTKYIKFISDTKREIIENAAGKKFRNVNPKYIKFSPTYIGDFEAGYKQYFEIDISAAYWFCAYDFGLITKATFEAGFGVPKKARLMAVGAAAATKDIFYFDGTEYQYQGIEFDNDGRKAFFNIASRVDEVMQIILEETPGWTAFYWVDAVFVKSEFVEYVAHRIGEFGFECKKIPLAWIRGRKAAGTIETMKITSEAENFTEFERKIYYRPKNRRKKTGKKPS